MTVLHGESKKAGASLYTSAMRTFRKQQCNETHYSHLKRLVLTVLQTGVTVATGSSSRSVTTASSPNPHAYIPVFPALEWE